jgi:hypothetical protein
MKKQDILNIRNFTEKHYGKLNADKLLRAKHKSQGFDQPLPDMVGLKQHVAECASDSIQEVLLFADGIRTYTQPIIYGLTDEQIELRAKLQLNFDDWYSFQEYVHYVQKRFRAHYDVLNYIKTHKVDGQKYYDSQDELCLLNPLFKQKKATSIEAGILALKRLKKENKYTATGINFLQIKSAVSNVFSVFDLPFTSVDGVASGALGHIFSGNKISVLKEGVEKMRSIGHVMAFFKSLGKWVFYDNNLGFIQVDDKVIEALKQDNLSIVNYKKVYFVKSKGEKFVSAWSNGSWDTDLVKDLYDSDNKLHNGIYYYKCNIYTTLSIIHKEDALMNESHKLCKITKEELLDEATVLQTFEKFKACIYANLTSNSMIFENIYKFIYSHFALAQKEPEIMDFLEKTLPTVILRPACSPMTHYWCHKIKTAMKGRLDENTDWFKLPKLRSLYVPEEQPNTPVELKKQLENEQQKLDENKPLTPCLPGQIRNAKTLKCRDRVKKEPKIEANNTQVKSENKTKKVRRSPCPKGMVRNSDGICVKKEEPCPPGQIRDKKTRLCHDRLDKKPCPEGQIRDLKTKECRDVAVYKF